MTDRPCNVVPIHDSADPRGNTDRPPPMGCELLQHVVTKQAADRRTLDNLDRNVSLLVREVRRLVIAAGLKPEEKRPC